MNEDANPGPFLGPVECAVQFRRRINEGEEDALQLGPRKKAYVRPMYLLL